MFNIAVKVKQTINPGRYNFLTAPYYTIPANNGITAMFGGHRKYYEFRGLLVGVNKVIDK